MAKQLYCSRCGAYQGEIEKGRLAKSARIVCETCDDKHITDELTNKTISELVDSTTFKRTFNKANTRTQG